MGLDMYLSAHKYVGDWDHSHENDRKAYAAIVKAVGVDGYHCGGSPSLTVRLHVAYWCKANQIHRWFVDNVQGGEDECKPHSVSREQLQDLLHLCEEVKSTKDASKLPPVSGFFFGGTDIDEYYWQDIDLTITQLKSILDDKRFEDWDLEYQSSW